MTHEAVLSEVLITNYDDMKSEYDELDQSEQAEFLDMLGGDLKNNFDKGAMVLECYLNVLDDSECGQIVDRLMSFLDKISPDE